MSEQTKARQPASPTVTVREAGALTAAMVALMAAPLVYALYFGGHIHLPAGGPEAWAQFGDFIGGVVGTVVGLATVLLVLETLRTTRGEAADTRREMQEQTLHLASQVDLLQRQQRLGDLQKRLDGVLNAWNALMERESPRLTTSIGAHGGLVFGHKGGQLRTFLYNSSLPNELTALKERDVQGSARYQWRDALIDEINVLIELNTYCGDYEQAVSGSRDLTDYYRHRVNPVVRALTAFSVLPSEVSSGLHVGRLFYAR